MNTYFYPEERIAIVAMGGMFPDAATLDIFWQNILQKKVSIRDVPPELCDEKLFYRPEVFGKPHKDDKTYTKIASLSGLDYDYSGLCRKYRIPPAVAQHMDPNQHVAIYCVDQALQSLRSELPKERTAVILGTGAQGMSFTNIIRRIFYPKVRARLEESLRKYPGVNPKDLETFLEELSTEALKGTIPITEDSAPGMLQNITAARISNIFDYWGPSFTVDAACASALAAASTGIAGLLRHEYDAVITGGVEVTLDEVGLIVFCGINALSPDGSFPFDERANGFVVGLGGGVLILKRLSDALRDQDRIIALISGFGQGSDGKGKYIAAPSEEGQIRVIQNACKMAGYPAETIEYIEAHGTGTTVGDVVEVTALKKAFRALGVTRQNYCGLGSVKSNIGHLRYASGAPGIIKVALAFQNQLLPPTANIRKVNPKLELEGSPFYIMTDAKPWLETKSHPRRANVSTYGFGGADFHMTMEEFRPEFLQKFYASAEVGATCESFPGVKKTTPTAQTVAADPILHPEVVFFAGDSLAELKQSYLKLVESINPLDFQTSVSLNNSAASARKQWRVAICACSKEELAEKWAVYEEYGGPEAKSKESALKLRSKGIYSGHGEPVTPDQMAWMFPGQASQYPNMLQGIYENHPAIGSFAQQVDAIWQARYGYTVTSLIFGSDEAFIEQQLKETKHTHPAMFLSNMAIYKLFKESGVEANYMIGHSLGEITALHAGGMLDLKSAVQLIGERGFSFDEIPEPDRGFMVSVKASRAEVNRLIRSSKLKVAIANINSPEQTVAGGPSEEMEKFIKELKREKITHTRLKVSHAFHTKLTRQAADRFYQKISTLGFGLPKAKIMACHRVDFYPGSPEDLKEMPDLLREQIVSPVNFVDSVQKLYDLGVRVFIETGPGTVLTNLATGILNDKDVKVIAANRKQLDGLTAFRHALAELFSLGVDICMAPTHPVWCPNDIKTGNVSSGIHAPAAVSPAGTAYPTAPPAVKESLVYSGVSMGLPGATKKLFFEDNFRLLLEGKNLIDKLSDDEQQRLLDLQITRIVKDEETATFKKLTALNEVIQLAGKFGKLDMSGDYLVDEKLLEQMTLTVCAGVAAGYEALRDAGIPLVREYTRTATGALLPGRLLLPEEMRAGTGIIFANGLFPIEMIIDQVSRQIAWKYGSKARADLIDFYETIIAKVSDPEVKKLLADWFARRYSDLLPAGGETAVYEFNHHFMALLSSQSNNRLAQFTGAMGPNFFLSAACSSTTSAVTVAEDLIRAGHAERMIVIAADSASTKEALPWIGAGFLSIGAASDSDNVFEAAVPFDKRRNGMILGAGAVGLVVEKEADVAKRGMNGICRILGTHAFNTAGHQSKIDSDKYAIELDKFITRMEREHGLNRHSLAAGTVYLSHETYSARKGGCSYTEKMALEKVFGGDFRRIKVINTKGMTGHTMGASIEEAVAARVLQYQQIPPIVNYKEPDPDLEGLNLSQGGPYDFEYVLRMVSGFGGQGNYHLLQKVASGDGRFVDRNRYQAWLQQITNSPSAVLKQMGRLLVAEGELQESGKQPEPKPQPEVSVANHTPPAPVPNPLPSGPAVGQADWITGKILDIYAEVTKYPKEMLDLSMELEADLGVDTVKQATIFGMIAESFQVSPEERLSPSDYPTIGHMVNLILRKAGVSNTTVAPNPSTAPAEPASTGDADVVLQVISEITQYPVEMLEKDMEMEADLGIDTVKQATIFAMLGEKFGISEDFSLNISQYRTIGSVIDFIHAAHARAANHKSASGTRPATLQSQTAAKENIPALSPTQPPKVPENKNSQYKVPNASDVESEVLAAISEITKYPVEMLEKDMEMEADLGIDTVKQASILAMLAEKFGMPDNPNLNLSQNATIAAVIRMVQETMPAQTAESPAETVAADLDAEPIPSGVKPHSPGRELCLQIPVFAVEKPGPKDFDLRDKKLWILGDKPEMVHRVALYFKKWTGYISELIITDHLKNNGLESQVELLVKNPADVVIDCTHIGEPVDFDELSQSDTVTMLSLSGEARFIVYKKLVEHIPEPELRIICLISMDGCHGFARPVRKIRDPFYGALSGFYKSLSKEWPKSHVKILDLGPVAAGNPGDTGTFNDKLLAKVADELQCSSPDCEIGYSAGKRYVLKISYLDQAKWETIDWPENPHLLFTGGGYGITAEVIQGLAKERKGKFTILGRTTLPENIASLAELDEAGLEKKRQEIHNALKANGKKVTPLMVQTEYDKIVKAISVFNLIRRVEQQGSQALYIPCDVSDYEALKNAMSSAVAKFGPVHGLIHAAGIEKSRLLNQKPPAEFKEIFAVKAGGLCNLYRLADLNPLKAFIGFSSISGRFGNEAQSDYSAANSFINTFMAMIRSRRPQIHALSMVWSGWKDTGIAWRNEFVKTHSEEMGIHLIEPQWGTAAFIQNLNHRAGTAEIILSKGIHHFISQRMLNESLPETPLIDWVAKQDGKYTRAYKVLSVKRDPIINQHRLGATPLVPAVAYMEMIAEFHSICFGRGEQYCFRRLELQNPMKLYHDKARELILEAKPGGSPQSLEAVFSTFLDSKYGITRRIELNKMNIGNTLGEYLPLLEIRSLENESMEQGFTRESLEDFQRKTGNAIQLGPLFIGLQKENNTYKRNDHGAIYSMIFPEEELANPKYRLDSLLVNPAFMDSMFQACGVHTTFLNDRVYLPWKVEEFGVVKAPKERGRYKAYALAKNRGDDFISYDVIMVNERDEVCYYAKNITMKAISM